MTESTQVPGAVLKAGSYSIAVLDYLTDRSILQVTDETGKLRSTFIGIRRANGTQGSHPGMNLWSNAPSNRPSFREWVLPSGEALEFAYPKEDAVAIAKVNRDQVPAIDPESEGKAPAVRLPANDMQVVTLWLLSTTTVGPHDKEAIAATRFHPDTNGLAGVQQAPQPSFPTQGADARPMASLVKPASSADGEKPIRPRLPHTAGNLPLFGLLGLVCLLASGLLPLAGRVRRNQE